MPVKLNLFKGHFSVGYSGINASGQEILIGITCCGVEAGRYREFFRQAHLQAFLDDDGADPLLSDIQLV
jgi:hypothetical protein